MIYYAAITFLIQIDYIFFVIIVISCGLVLVGRYFYNICTSVSDSAPGCDTDISIPAHRYFDTCSPIFRYLLTDISLFRYSNVDISNNSFKQTLHQQQLLFISNDNFVVPLQLHHYAYLTQYNNPFLTFIN